VASRSKPTPDANGAFPAQPSTIMHGLQRGPAGWAGQVTVWKGVPSKDIADLAESSSGDCRGPNAVPRYSPVHLPRRNQQVIGAKHLAGGFQRNTKLSRRAAITHWPRGRG
jgi:hypothetical protein